MAKERSSPEEQLLNLIEKEAGPETVKFKRKRTLFLSFSNLNIFWLSLGKGIHLGIAKLGRGLKEPNLKVLNKIFFIMSISLLGYSIMDFVFGRPDITQLIKKAQRPREKIKPAQKVLVSARPFLHYLEMVRRRNIFSPIVLKEAEKPPDKRKLLQEMLKDLSLVGIAWGKEPVAMIEDKAAKKTYFLKKGEMINRFTIDTIFENRVLLRYEKEKIELM